MSCPRDAAGHPERQRREEIEFRYSTHGARSRQPASLRRHPAESRAPLSGNRIDARCARSSPSISSIRPCPECGGTRLNRAARQRVRRGSTLPEITHLTVAQRIELFCSAESRRLAWRDRRRRSSRKSASRLRFLADVGLDYLTLDRSAETLSGGEAQRIRLASQVGSGLVGVMYILDEPSIGLHQRDNQRLLATLEASARHRQHRDRRRARRGSDPRRRPRAGLGPGAGVHGGQIVAQGTPQRHRGQCRIHHRAISCPAGADRAARRCARRADPTALQRHRRHAATTCKNVTRAFRSA